MTATRIRRVLLLLSLASCALPAYSQPRRASSSTPKIDVENYVIQATLKPEAHEVKATAEITFKPVESTDIVLFEISDNLSIQKVLNAQGVELEFAQDESGPGVFTVRFVKALPADQDVTIKVEYSGGFDRDRYSRLYTKDESSAYIGMEGSYLLYSAKWFPMNKFLVDRATATVQVTAPLGQTVVGPGTQMPVVTKGISETFGWSSAQPILPNSIVVGQYFERKVQSGDFVVNCFAGQERLDSAEKSAKELAKILEYYQKIFGASAAGQNIRLVEVDDKLSAQPGMLGTVFITRRELSMTKPPVRELARRAACQWWSETVGTQSTDDLWLVDGLAYYSTALYLGQGEDPAGFKDEIDNLAVLGLKFEDRSAVRAGFGLGYRTEAYESVVAGKGAWVFHMLHEILGDERFSQLLQQYAKEYSGKGGTTTILRGLAEKLYGSDLKWFFGEWLDTTGVPTLTADSITYRTQSGFKVLGSVKQERDLFRMPLEVEVVAQEGKTERKTIEVDGKTSAFEVETATLPIKVVLDPDNKVLRDSTELQTRVQIALGNDLKDKGEYVEAIRAYEKALKVNPRKSMAHFRLAEVFFEQMNLNSSANSFRDALNGDKDPKWTEVWSYIYLGKINDILGQRQRALAEYSKAVNTKDDTNGAQAEAQKWINTPFVREQTTMGKEAGEPD